MHRRILHDIGALYKINYIILVLLIIQLLLVLLIIHYLGLLKADESSLEALITIEKLQEQLVYVPSIILALRSFWKHY